MTILKMPKEGNYERNRLSLYSAIDNLKTARNLANLTVPSDFSNVQYINSIKNTINEYLTICEKIEASLISGDQNYNEVLNEYKTIFKNHYVVETKERETLINI